MSEPRETFRELYERVKDEPIRINTFRILRDPQARTEPHVIARELPAVQQAGTMDELRVKLDELATNLKSLNTFRVVDIAVLPGPEEKGQLDVDITVKDKKSWWSANAGTYVQQGNKGSVDAHVRMRNLLGHAEVYELQGSRDTAAGSEYALSVLYPRLAGTPLQAELRLTKDAESHVKTSSFTQSSQGVSAHLRSDAHELAYELGLRSVTPLSLMASKAVEKFRGPSLKSAVKHSFLLDRRDNPLDPSAGYVVRSTSEVAGLGPLSANLLRYARTEVAAAATVPLSELVGLKLAASLGVLVPWGKDWASQSTSVADRMFVGGPESIRGFRSRGVGPSDLRRLPAEKKQKKEGAGSSGDQDKPPKVKRDYLGGDLKLTTFAALTCKLPHETLQSLRMKAHVFVNAGSVVPITGDGMAGVRSAPQRLMQGMRVSMGVGLTCALSVGTLELNYCHVRRWQEFDRVKRGIQFGVIPPGA